MQASPYVRRAISVGCALCADFTFKVSCTRIECFEISFLGPDVIDSGYDQRLWSGQLWTCLSISRGTIKLQCVPEWPSSVNGEVLPKLELVEGGCIWTCHACSVAARKRMHGGVVECQR